MLCKTRQDMYNYLDSLDFSEKKETEMSSVYFLIKENGIEEMVYFMPYNGSYFESPCMLREWQMKKEELRKYVEELYTKESWDAAYEYEKLMQIDDNHYEIDNFQCEPYLKENIEIIQMVSESECLQWLIQKRKERKEK